MARSSRRLAAIPFDPDVIADRGRKIYERHRSKLEAEHLGEFAVIDVGAERLFMGDSPETAYCQALEAGATGPFYVVRVGDAAVYCSTRLSGWPRSRARSSSQGTPRTKISISREDHVGAGKEFDATIYGRWLYVRRPSREGQRPARVRDA